MHVSICMHLYRTLYNIARVLVYLIFLLLRSTYIIISLYSHFFSEWPITDLLPSIPTSSPLPFVSHSSGLPNHNPRLPSWPPFFPRVSASPATPFSASLLSAWSAGGCPLHAPFFRPRRSHSSPSLLFFCRLCGCQKVSQGFTRAQP